MLGAIHVLDDDGQEVAAGEIGTIWADAPQRFEYLNDEDKTRGQHNDRGWTTVGDVGFLDEEGYLYLTDRKSYMIISGGVNIYPQEIEDVLIGHARVHDVAVFGVPNAEFGEEVKAVVQPDAMDGVGPELVEELLAYCRSRLAGYKCPRTIDFDASLPRTDTGKLYKRRLKDRYWAAAAAAAAATAGTPVPQRARR
jgi:fatty-acyl-CoA synthase